MKLHLQAAPGRSAAGAMLMICAAARLFWGLAADHPEVANAAWLCPIVGLLIYLPFALAMGRAAALGADSPWGNLANAAGPLLHAAEAIFALLLIYDCALSMRLMANTANLLALSDRSLILLLLPLAALAAICVLLGAESMGSCARLWLRILPPLLLAVFLVQAKVYNPRWLTPFFGDGAADILGGGIYSAGCLALMSLTWMFALPDRNKKPLLLYIGIAALLAALMLAARQMLCPSLEGAALSRSSRIKLILSNGRAALGLQMPLAVLWYAALMQLIGTEAVTAACCLRRLLPRVPQWSFALAEGLLTIIAASSGATGAQVGRRLYPYLYAVLALLLALAMAAALRKRGGRKCEA